MGGSFCSAWECDLRSRLCGTPRRPRQTYFPGIASIAVRSARAQSCPAPFFLAPWPPHLLYWQAKESTSCLLAFHCHLRPERESVAHAAMIQTFRRGHYHAHLEFSSVQPWLLFACALALWFSLAESLA